MNQVSKQVSLKKMLVPTDFSSPANNALKYALQLAQKAGSELKLIHVYSLPDLIDDPILVIPTEEEVEAKILKYLEKLKRAILKNYPTLKISYCTAPGIAAEEINNCALKEKTDLIVLGAQGAGYLEERVFGSTASQLIQKTKTPVLVINKKVRFRELKQIVLTADFQKTDHQKILKPLKDLTKLYHAHICVLNIYPHIQLIPSLEEIPEGFRLDYYLSDTEHTFFSLESNQVLSAITDFIKQHDIDMVTMIAREHSIFSRIFREPLTKKMSFHSSIPLLVLHE